MKIVWFIGSGFIYLIANIIKAQSEDSSPSNTHRNARSLHKELLHLNNLWGELDPIFLPIRDLLPDRNNEQLIEHVRKILDSPLVRNNFKILSGDSIPKTRLDLVKNEMKGVGNKFTDFEKAGGYGDIYKFFPKFGDSLHKAIKANRIENLHVCSTNYDGVFDSLLTYYDAIFKTRQFLLKDGFYYKDFIERNYRQASYSIAHIHGSHRFCRVDKQKTQKLGRGEHNPSPVMIYDSQQFKEGAILANDVLSIYLDELARKLANCDRVVVLGNSFKTEPHLKRLINIYFNRPSTEMVICSDKPLEVASELGPHYDYPIQTQLTGHIKSENQLIELFDKMFGKLSTSILATA